MLIEDILLAMIVLLIGSQVVIPLIAGRQMFPQFRRKTYEERRLQEAEKAERRAREQLAAAEREAHALELQTQAERVQNRALDNYVGHIEPDDSLGHRMPLVEKEKN